MKNFLSFIKKIKSNFLYKKERIKHLPSIGLKKAGAFDPYPGVFFS